MAKATVPPEIDDQPDATPGADDQESMTIEEAKEALKKAHADLRAKEEHIKKVNDENAKRRRALEEIEKEREARETEKLTEVEKLRREATIARREAEESRAALAKEMEDSRRQKIRREIERHAQKMNFHAPEIAPDIVMGQGIGDVTIAEDGAVEGAKEAVERLAKRYPNLLNAQSRPGTPQRRDEGRRTEYGPDLLKERKARQEKVDPYAQELEQLGLGGRM